jgi:thioredoxin reductase (NADPH)
MATPVDCVVIGAGPAGLTAAIYLSRFNLQVRVMDGGASRCALIPRTRNHPGFPGGIPGRDLLLRLREQAAEFGAHVTDTQVSRIEKCHDGTFAVITDAEDVAARTVLLATGIVNNRPPIVDADHDIALNSGLLRYCPICDGYEVADRAVGVIGAKTHGYNEAVFIRMYTANVTLIAPGDSHELTDHERSSLSNLGVRLLEGPCGRLRLEDGRIVAPTREGDMAFDTIYPALGSVIRSNLAIGLGARVSGEGCLMVDEQQHTNIPGLYAAGDVVKGLDQISHAMGEASVAATAIRNDLSKIRLLTREAPKDETARSEL